MEKRMRRMEDATNEEMEDAGIRRKKIRGRPRNIGLGGTGGRNQEATNLNLMNYPFLSLLTLF